MSSDILLLVTADLADPVSKEQFVIAALTAAVSRRTTANIKAKNTV